MIVLTVEGDVSESDIEDYVERIRADPAADAGFDELVDLRALERPSLPPQVLRQWARHFRDAGPVPPHRMAIVASAEAIFGMSRLYQMEREDESLQIQVFREMDEARAWLGLDRPPDER